MRFACCCCGTQAVQRLLLGPPSIESDRTMHASRVSARVPPSILLRYSLASGAAILALLLTLLMRPILHEPLFSLFYVAVLVSSWYGGLGPGLLATALSILLADYYVFPPVGILVFDADTFIRLSIEVFT